MSLIFVMAFLLFLIFFEGWTYLWDRRWIEILFGSLREINEFRKIGDILRFIAIGFLIVIVELLKVELVVCSPIEFKIFELNSWG